MRTKPVSPSETPPALLRPKPSLRRNEEATPVRMGINPTTSRAETPAPAYFTPVYCSQK